MLIQPKGCYRRRLQPLLQRLEQSPELDYMLHRARYYNKIVDPTPLPTDAPSIGSHRLHSPKVYFFDTYEYLRWFPPHLQWCYCPGDITYVPDAPSITKSRPLVEDNANGVLMKLDKVRHFVFLNDQIPFNAKQDKVIFRGKVSGKESRVDFMRKFHGQPWCDAGDVSGDESLPASWQVPKLTFWEHLQYKFIMALEGNDVASNLKWIMSSNSLAVMPRPTCETWFMEGTLLPNVHYVEVRPDFADLEERIHYYIAHPAEAEEIIRNANQYVAQFKDKHREDAISILTLQTYFEKTGQLPPRFSLK